MNVIGQIDDSRMLIILGCPCVAFAGTVLLFFLEWRLNHQARAQRRRSLLSRETMDPEDWHRRFFAPHGVTEKAATRLCGEFARILKCDLTALRPEDSFEGSLAIRERKITGMPVDHEKDECEDWLLDEAADHNAEMFSHETWPNICDLTKWYEQMLIRQDDETRTGDICE